MSAMSPATKPGPAAELGAERGAERLVGAARCGSGPVGAAMVSVTATAPPTKSASGGDGAFHVADQVGQRGDGVEGRHAAGAGGLAQVEDAPPRPTRAARSRSASMLSACA